MLTGQVAQLESALRRDFAGSGFVSVQSGTAHTHTELVGRLACEYANAAHRAVYELFGVEIPLLKDPEPDEDPETLGDVIEDRLEAVTGNN